MYDFLKFETIRYFEDIVYTGKVIMDEAEMDHTNLLENMVKFNNKYRARSKKDKDNKWNTFDSVNAVYEGQELTRNFFRSRIFPIKAIQGKGRTRMLALRHLDLATQLKILSPK